VPASDIHIHSFLSPVGDCDKAFKLLATSVYKTVKCFNF